MDLLTRQEWTSVLSSLESLSLTERASLSRLLSTPTGTARLSPAGLGLHAYPGLFHDHPHVQVMDDALVRLARRDVQRLMVWMPPQHGKSTMISELFPAWYLMRFPNHSIIHVTYGQRFSSRWARASRDLTERHGNEVGGVSVRQDVRSVSEWQLSEGGGLIAAGVGTGISGRRADLLIVDDPVKDAEQAVSDLYREKVWDWWQSSARTRLRADGLIVIVQTRWHAEDLSGMILQAEGQDWEVVCLPALAEYDDALGREPGEALCPQMYDRDYLLKLKASETDYWWNCLYQQHPTQHGSLLWPAEFFEGDDLWFDEWPADAKMKTIALDPSQGKGIKVGDYSAYVMLAVTGEPYLWVEADMSNTRGGRRLIEDGVTNYESFRPDVFGVESNAFQDLYRGIFEEEFRKRGLLDFAPVGIQNNVKKELRIERLDEWLKTRRIKFRNTKGTKLMVQQLKDFPMGRHDDGPDALEMAVRLAVEYHHSLKRERFAGTI